MNFMSTENRIDTVTVPEAQTRLGELIRLGQRSGASFRIVENDKPLAWLVSPQALANLSGIVKMILSSNDSIADTLALYVDGALQMELQANYRDIEADKGIKLDALLE